MKIAILGFGAFGQAICKLLLHANTDIEITCLDLDATYVTEQIQKHFSDSAHRLIPLSSKNPLVDEVYKAADLVVIAVGSRFMKPVMQNLIGIMKPGSGLVNVAKALSPEGNIFFDEFISLGRDDIHYAALAGGMAAKDIMEGKITGATLACTSAEYAYALEKVFVSDYLQAQITTDVRGVESAGVLKNLISIHAGYALIQDTTSAIDEIVEKATQQIKEHADQLDIQPSTFDQTYCRDHPTYGDIRTSCYGGTRNFMLGQLWKKRGSFSEAVEHCAKKNITLEGLNTLRVLQKNQSNPLHTLPFVQDLLNELE